MYVSSFRSYAMHDSNFVSSDFVDLTRNFQRSNWPRGRAIYSWLRHCGMCCTREETVTKYNRRTRSRTPCQGCLKVLDLPRRKGWPRVLCARAHAGGAAHFFLESPHRHARTGNRPPCVALSFFSRPRDISGRALVTGYAPTSRQANFWQSSTAPRRNPLEVIEPITNLNKFSIRSTWYTCAHRYLFFNITNLYSYC